MKVHEEISIFFIYARSIKSRDYIGRSSSFVTFVNISF